MSRYVQLAIMVCGLAITAVVDLQTAVVFGCGLLTGACVLDAWRKR